MKTYDPTRRQVDFHLATPRFTRAEWLLIACLFDDASEDDERASHDANDFAIREQFTKQSRRWAEFAARIRANLEP